MPHMAVIAGYCVKKVTFFVLKVILFISVY